MKLRLPFLCTPYLTKKLLATANVGICLYSDPSTFFKIKLLKRGYLNETINEYYVNRPFR